MPKVFKMNNNEFSKKLEYRTKQFAIGIVRLSVTLPIIVEAKVIKNQLTKSATSIGANYREANRSRSKADFKNKISICESEASETIYWLDIIKELNWVNNYWFKEIIKEANEFLVMFTSIEKKLKAL